MVYICNDLTASIAEMLPLDTRQLFYKVVADPNNHLFDLQKETPLTGDDLKALFILRRKVPRNLPGTTITQVVQDRLVQMLTDARFQDSMIEAVTAGHQHMLLMETYNRDWYNQHIHLSWDRGSHKGVNLEYLGRFVPKGTKLCYGKRQVYHEQGYSSGWNTYEGVYLVLFDPDEHYIYKKHLAMMSGKTDYRGEDVKYPSEVQENCSNASSPFYTPPMVYDHRHKRFPDGFVHPYTDAGMLVLVGPDGLRFSNCSDLYMNERISRKEGEYVQY